MQATTSWMEPPRRLFIGVGILIVGLVWLEVFNGIDAVVFPLLHTDFEQAAFSFAKHVGTDGLFVLAAYWLVDSSKDVWRRLGYRGVKTRSLVLVGLLVVVLFFLIELLNIFWQLFLSLAVHMPLQPTDSYFSTLSTFTLPTQLFTYCICAPVGEETLFRGWLFQALDRRLPIIGAIVVSTAAFILMHVIVVGAGGAVVSWDATGMAQGVLLSICSALLLKYTKSLYPSIALHCLMNLAYVVFSLR
jgi:membrane protease YdiL (CAAX protease family)